MREAVSRDLGPKLNQWLRPVVPRELGVTEPTARRVDGWQKALIDIILDDYEVYVTSKEPLSLKRYMARGKYSGGQQNRTDE